MQRSAIAKKLGSWGDDDERMPKLAITVESSDETRDCRIQPGEGSREEVTGRAQSARDRGAFHAPEARTASGPRGEEADPDAFPSGAILSSSSRSRTRRGNATFSRTVSRREAPLWYRTRLPHERGRPRLRIAPDFSAIRIFRRVLVDPIIAEDGFYRYRAPKREQITPCDLRNWIMLNAPSLLSDDDSANLLAAGRILLQPAGSTQIRVDAIMRMPATARSPIRRPRRPLLSACLGAATQAQIDPNTVALRVPRSRPKFHGVGEVAPDRAEGTPSPDHDTPPATRPARNDVRTGTRASRQFAGSQETLAGAMVGRRRALVTFMFRLGERQSERRGTMAVRWAEPRIMTTR